MAVFLGVDGGGTGCRAVVADDFGRVLGLGSAGPANIASDPETARKNILIATSAALRAATIAETTVSELVAGLGLAGANAAGAGDWLRQGLPFASSRIETDAVTATLGALGDADGIVAAMGTGSVFTIRTGATIQQFGGWGFVLGDEGSGARIGQATLARCLRAADGFAEMTPLLSGLLHRFGGTGGVVRFATQATPADFASLAPEVLAASDPAATAIWQDAVATVSNVIAGLQARADLPITFIGGLGPSYAGALPALRQRAAIGTALDGALRLAREAS